MIIDKKIIHNSFGAISRYPLYLFCFTTIWSSIEIEKKNKKGCRFYRGYGFSQSSSRF